MKIEVVLKGIFLLLVLKCKAQQEAQFTQYMYNTANINPAYSGSRGLLSLLAMHRNQWQGFDGAPTTNVVTAHSPISQKLGAGLSFINENLGPSNETTISIDCNYTIPTSTNYKLAFGIRTTANIFNVNFNILQLPNPDDQLPINRSNIDNNFTPNFGLGLYWYSNHSYFGLSSPSLLENKYYDNSNDIKSIGKEKIHLYCIAGYIFTINNKLKCKPSLLSKVVKGSPIQLDVSANLLFYEKLTIGLAHRWNASISALTGFQINNNWLLGYAYDSDITRFGNYNKGSHEIFLRYEIDYKQSKITSPRFF